MSLRKRGAFWHIDLRHRGRRVREATGFRIEERQAAEKLHDELKARLWKEPVKSEHGFYAAITKWLDEKPRHTNELSLIKILKKKYPNRPLSNCTADSFAKIIPTSSNGYYNRFVSLIMAVMHLAQKNKWVRDVEIIKKKDTLDRIRFIYAEEWEKLYEELPVHVKPIAHFAILTGLRLSNVLRLEWTQVDLNRHIAWIPANKSKNKTPISVPLNKAAMAILSAQQRRHDVFVFTYRGKPIRSYKTAWKGAIERAGITDFRRHDLRHTWASWHLMNGAQTRDIKELGAWKDSRMVERYAHLSAEHLAKCAENFKPVRHTKPTQRRAA